MNPAVPQGRSLRRSQLLGRLAVLVAALLVVSTVFPSLQVGTPAQVQVQELGGEQFPIRHEEGNAYVCDLSALYLEDMADTTASPFRSTLEMLEDDTPLYAHVELPFIRSGMGSFRHWESRVVFSSRTGSDPAHNGSHYAVSYVRHRPWVPAFQLPALTLSAVSLLLLAALAVAQLRGADVSTGSWNDGWARGILGAALAGVLFGQVYGTRTNLTFVADSDSYTEIPSMSSRPPGYYAFMMLVSDPRRIRQEGETIRLGGDSNKVLHRAPSESPIARVVFAQKLALAAAFVLVFLGLASVLPCLLAAAMVLPMAQFLPKAPVPADVLAVVAVGLFLAPVAVGLVRRGRKVSLREVGLVLLTALVLRPVLGPVLGLSMVSLEADMLLSEPLAMAAHAVFLILLVLYVIRGRIGWLYGAAVMAGVAFSIRPASIFVLGTVAVTAAACFLVRRKPGWLHLAGVLACALALCAAPNLVKRISGAKNQDVSMRKWAMAAFALALADPGDVARFKDPDVRRFLDQSLQEKAKFKAGLKADESKPPYDPEITYLGYYTYYIVLGQSQKISCEKYRDGSPEQLKERHRLLGEMAVGIFRAHPLRLLRLDASGFQYMVRSGTRLSDFQPFWVTLIGAALLALLAGNRLAAAGATLAGAHVLHLVVISLFDQPLSRYVYATESMAVIGIWLIGWGALQRVREGQTTVEPESD